MNCDIVEFSKKVDRVIALLKNEDMAIPVRKISRLTGIDPTPLKCVIQSATFSYPIYEDCMGRIGILHGEQ